VTLYSRQARWRIPDRVLSMIAPIGLPKNVNRVLYAAVERLRNNADEGNRSAVNDPR